MSWTCRCELGDIECQQGKRKEKTTIVLGDSLGGKETEK